MQVHDRTTALVVDDEESIVSVLAMGLRFIGLSVSTSDCGADALSQARANPPDVVLLDVSLPDIDGFEVCRHMRSNGMTSPILFLTARGTVEDKVTGLNVGADDYVVKPFDLSEIAARVQALLRRGRPLASAARLRIGEVELDERSREVWRSRQQVALSVTEFELLRHLMVNAGHVQSKARLLKSVWRCDWEADQGVVETYVYYLRRKLNDSDQSLIRTVRGAGYLFRLSDDSGAR